MINLAFIKVLFASVSPLRLMNFHLLSILTINIALHFTDNLRQNYEHLKEKYKTADINQNQLQGQLDTANTEISRLIDENGRIANEIKCLNKGFSKDGGTLGNYRIAFSPI